MPASSIRRGKTCRQWKTYRPGLGRNEREERGRGQGQGQLGVRMHGEVEVVGISAERMSGREAGFIN